jgi:hypothetical protein
MEAVALADRVLDVSRPRRRARQYAAIDKNEASLVAPRWPRARCASKIDITILKRCF